MRRRLRNRVTREEAFRRLRPFHKRGQRSAVPHSINRKGHTDSSMMANNAMIIRPPQKIAFPRGDTQTTPLLTSPYSAALPYSPKATPCKALDVHPMTINQSHRLTAESTVYACVINYI
jgi:hypothetical protein